MLQHTRHTAIRSARDETRLIAVRMESLQLVARKFLSSEESSFRSLDTFVELFDPVVTYGAPPPLSFLELVRSIVSYYHGTLLVHSNLLDAATACFEPGGNAGESPTRITDDTLVRSLVVCRYGCNMSLHSYGLAVMLCSCTRLPSRCAAMLDYHSLCAALAHADTRAVGIVDCCRSTMRDKDRVQ